MRGRRLFGFAVAFVVLVGCAVSSDVSRFHRITPDLSGATFAVVPAREQSGSPQFAHYAERTTGHLIRHGFKPARDPAGARLRVEIDYGVGRGETTTHREPVYVRRYDPMYRFGFGTGFHHYPFAWSWDIVGFNTIERTYYPREFNLRIVDRTAPSDRRIVFEGTASNAGTDPSFAAVGDCLVDALFHEFPGVSGNSRSIAVPTSQCR